MRHFASTTSGDLLHCQELSTTKWLGLSSARKQLLAALPMAVAPYCEVSRF